MANQSASRRIGIIIVAAGTGTRLGYGQSKAQVAIAGETILTHALRGAVASGVATVICAVIPAGNETLQAVCSDAGRQVAGGVPRIHAVNGGATRSESVRAGLAALPDGLDAILVHDAARALTPPDVFERVALALEAGADVVVPAVPVTDTIKTVRPAPDGDDRAGNEIVTGTPDRSTLRAVQTPQGFDAAALRAIHDSTRGPAEATDDAGLAETAGIPVHVVAGSPRSFKITTPLDLMLAEAILTAGEPHRWVEG